MLASALSNEQFERWESLMLQRTLDKVNGCMQACELLSLSRYRYHYELPQAPIPRLKQCCEPVKSGMDSKSMADGSDHMQRDVYALQMDDVVYCPRCQAIVLEDADHCARCARCGTSTRNRVAVWQEGHNIIL